MEGVERLDDGNKPYLVVEFPDGVQLVAAKWMTGDNDSCYWPNFTSNVRYDTAVKNLEDADSSWKSFPIRNIVAAADTYEKGKQKLREAESFSDVNSGYDTEDKRKIRRDRASKKKLMLYNEFSSSGSKRKSREEKEEESSSLSDSENEQSSQRPLLKKSAIPSYPTLPSPSCNKKNANLTHVPAHQSTSTTSSEDVMNTTPRRYQSPKSTTPQQLPKSLPLSLQGLGSPKRSPLKKYTDLTEFELYNKRAISELKFKVNSILSTQKEILEELRTLKSTPVTPIAEEANQTEFPSQDLPLASKENLDCFEEKLRDSKFQQFMVKELRKAGGQDVKSVVFILLPKLLTNDLAQQYSWIGGKGKNIFSTLAISKLILDVVRLHHPAATDTEIAVPIKNWLRHARERKDRLMKKAAEEAVE